MFLVVVTDTLRLLYEAEFLAQSESHASTITYKYLQGLQLTFFSLYTLDLIIRISAYLQDYFFNLYNLIDIFVVCDYLAHWILVLNAPYFELYVGYRLIRGLRIFRIFRIIPQIKSLETVVNALAYTMRTSVMDVVFLSLLLIFVLAVVGQAFFGNDPSLGDAYLNWSNLSESFLTIWVYICGDGWLPYQDRLRRAGFGASQGFSVLLIFLGNFMISNLFIGVISQNVYEASLVERNQILRQQKAAKIAKREIFFRKQQRDLLQLVNQVFKPN